MQNSLWLQPLFWTSKTLCWNSPLIASFKVNGWIHYDFAPNYDNIWINIFLKKKMDTQVFSYKKMFQLHIRHEFKESTNLTLPPWIMQILNLTTKLYCEFHYYKFLAMTLQCKLKKDREHGLHTNGWIFNKRMQFPVKTNSECSNTIAIGNKANNQYLCFLTQSWSLDRAEGCM